MLMVMYMKESGNVIRQMVEECICIAMDPSLKATGRRTRSMVKVLKYGQTHLGTTDSTAIRGSMVLATSDGTMTLITSANFIIIMFRVPEPIHGQMVECLKEIGIRIKCMEKESSHGLMVGNTLENTETTRKLDTVNLCGPMDGSSKVSGWTVSNMGEAYT